MFRSMEFELPALSTLLILMLCYVYFSKKRISLLENKAYEVMLISSLISSFIDTIIHVICSIHTFEEIQNNYYLTLEILNKFVSTGLVLVFSMLCFYTLVISNQEYRKKNKKVTNVFLALNILFFLITWFCHIELLDAGLAFNANGSLMAFAFVGVAFWLILTLIITIKNYKKDKRYYAIFMILGILLILYICAYFVKALIIYDVAMALFCYIMYFTIENPDVKMLEEFRKNREYADATNREKELFLFNLTQDIRKPLNNIGAACNELSMMTDNKEIIKGVNYIDYNDRDALSIINNVLDVNSMAASRIKIYNSVYNPKSLVVNVARMVNSKIPNKVKFRVNIDKSIPDALYGDPIRIKQIIKILLENACIHTKSGYIELEAHEITKNDICRLIITVEDSGKGILADQINEIFSREDIDNEIDDNAHKLSTAKSISIVLGGMLMCTSEIGKGSKFTLILDQRKDETKTKELERIEEYIDKVTAVVVSENKEYLEKVTNKLIKNNIDAVGTDLGAKAIEKIRKNPNYDYIILDEELEILNVDEILRKLREIKDFNSKVIVITKDMESERYIKTGFNGIISRRISVKDIDILNK